MHRKKGSPLILWIGEGDGGNRLHSSQATVDLVGDGGGVPGQLPELPVDLVDPRVIR